jgi:hydroxyacylglutathione hydrolase
MLNYEKIVIQAIPAFKDNYIWMLINLVNQQAIVIDPGDATPVLKELKKQRLALAAILITHHHFDHCNGIEALLEKYTVPVYGPANEFIKGVSQPLNESVEITIWNNIVFKILDIPGHTAGHIAYYTEGALFCGDTLFSAGCGKLFEGTPEQMVASLQKIANLPDETKIYCAHEYTLNNLRFAQTVEPANEAIQDYYPIIYQLRQQGKPSLPSILAQEKLINPFLRCALSTVINAVENYANKKLINITDIFTYLRLWKNNFIC